jgi:hypothetical protein
LTAQFAGDAGQGFIALAGQAASFLSANLWAPEPDGAPDWTDPSTQSDPWTPASPGAASWTPY